MKTIAVGIVGAGTMGALYATALSQCAHSSLCGICDINLEKARNLAKRFDVESIFQR